MLSPDLLAQSSSVIHEPLESQANAAMFLGHMRINRTAYIEDSHAYPADMGFARSTRHVVAAFRLLHQRLAFWASFDILFFLELFERFISTRRYVFVFCTIVTPVPGVSEWTE